MQPLSALQTLILSFFSLFPLSFPCLLSLFPFFISSHHSLPSLLFYFFSFPFLSISLFLFSSHLILPFSLSLSLSVSLCLSFSLSLCLSLSLPFHFSLLFSSSPYSSTSSSFYADTCALLARLVICFLWNQTCDFFH